jgi:FemAB-related protein (PEP-CTERM system-associated)
MAPVVRTFADSRSNEWDQFVRTHAGGTVFHLTAWKTVLERSFGYQPEYLLAERDGRISGVLPLFLVKNFAIGKALISTPFGVYGGVIADDEDSSRALTNAACDVAVKQQVQFLELRNRTEETLDERFHTKELYVSFDRELPGNEDALMKSFPRDTRYMVRKAQKAGLRTELGNHQVDALHEIYAISVRNLGTPVFARKHFRNIVDAFGEQLEITGIYLGSKMIAGVMSFKFGNWIVPYYSGSTEESKKTAANNFLYWEVMKNAMAAGMTHFDFGRSKVNTGAWFFKTQWSMTEHKLPYRYFLVKRKEMPNFSPTNARFKFAIEAWKKMPIGIAKLIGPPLVKLFP